MYAIVYILLAVGIGLFVAGTWMISPPIALIVLGAFAGFTALTIYGTKP